MDDEEKIRKIVERIGEIGESQWVQDVNALPEHLRRGIAALVGMSKHASAKSVANEYIRRYRENREPPLSYTLPGPGKAPPEWDLEKNKPVTERLSAYDYVYAAGSGTSEIVRLFILPPDFIVEYRLMPQNRADLLANKEKYEWQKTTMLDWKDSKEKIPGSHARIPNGGRVIGPTDREELYTLITNYSIYQLPTGKHRNSQIRHGGRIVREFPDGYDFQDSELLDHPMFRVWDSARK